MNRGGEDPNRTIPEPDPEEVAAIIISDDDDADLPIDIPLAVSTPKREPRLSQKQPLEERSPRSLPPKKQATGQKERSSSPQEQSLPKEVMEGSSSPRGMTSLLGITIGSTV